MSKTVYCIRSGGRLKIGYSAQFEGRLSSLRGGSPDDVEVVLTIPAPRRVETALHRKLAEYRVRHEWFEDRPEVLSVLREVLDRGADEVLRGFLDPERPAPQIANETAKLRSPEHDYHFDTDRLSCLQGQIIAATDVDLYARRDVLACLILAQRASVDCCDKVVSDLESDLRPDYATLAERVREAADLVEAVTAERLGSEIVKRAHDDLERGIKDGAFARERGGNLSGLLFA